MASLARVTGTVLSVPPAFKGNSKATGNPFVIETVKVLVANSDVTTLNFDRDDTGKIEAFGGIRELHYQAPIDVLVEVGVYRNEPQFRAVRQWLPTEEEALASIAAAEGVLSN